MKIRDRLPLLAVLCCFSALLLLPEVSAQAARDAMLLCAQTLIPSLFPFFIAANLLNELGASKLTANALAPLGARLGMSGHGVSAFIIGVTGGYPLGASYIAQLRAQGIIGRDDASRLIVFCNNSGPAFIVGAAGVGVFGSAPVGFFLYAVHILAALIFGVIICPKAPCDICYDEDIFSPVSLSAAFTASVKRAADSMIGVCSFVVAFSAINGVLDAMDITRSIAGELSFRLGAEISWCTALLAGILELGNGIGSMAGLAISPINLALAAFILSWGGLSVHFQTFSMIAGTDIKTARYMIGRFLTALIAAALALLGAAAIF